MTWRELRDRLSDFDDQQLDGRVCFYSDRDEDVWILQLYIAEKRKKDLGGYGGDIKKGMPYLEF